MAWQSVLRQAARSPPGRPCTVHARAAGLPGPGLAHAPPCPTLLQSQGFEVDGKVRTIPLEVMVKGDKVPVYEETLEDLGR